MEKVVEYYSTTDIGMATYLTYKGFQSDTKKEDGKPTIFIFEGSKLIRSVVNGYEESEEAKLLAIFKATKKKAIVNYKKGFYN